MMIKYEKLHFCTPVTLMGGGGYSLAHVQLLWIFKHFTC